MEDQEILPEVTLKKITETLHDSIKNAHEVVGTYQEKLKNVIERENSVKNQRISLDKDMSEFSDRQRAVADIENVVALNKQAQESILKTNNLMAQYNEDKKRFEEYKRSETERLTNIRINTQKESDLLVEQRKSIENEVNRRVAEFITQFKNSGVK